MLEALFGSKTAANVLLYISYLGEGHIRGIATDLKLSPGQVDRTIKRLESAGILVGTPAGRTRIYKLSPRFPYKTELTAIADKAIGMMPDSQRELFIQRRRPRRTGKKL